VRDTLRSLGARVEDPEAKGTEDGKLFRDGGQAVLEIKGRDGPIKLADVRQVVQWAAEATAKDGIEYEALILGNPDCHKPLEDRGEVLAPNAAAYALTSGVGVLKTTQLFAALRQKRISCRFRGWCHRPGRGGQSPPSESIARAMTAQGEW
jgi:hypothetical protein